MKVAEKGYRMLVVTALIMHHISMTKVYAHRVHQTQGAQVMQCCQPVAESRSGRIQMSPATVTVTVIVVAA